MENPQTAEDEILYQEMILLKEYEDPDEDHDCLNCEENECDKCFRRNEYRDDESSSICLENFVVIGDKMVFVYYCRKCRLGFTAPTSLDNHICFEKMKKFVAVETFQCQFCAETFWSNEDVDDHQANCEQREDSNDEYVSTEDDAGKNNNHTIYENSSSNEEVNEIILKKSSNINHHTCPHCSKVFSQATFLNQHISSKHRTNRIKKYKCDMCDYATNDSCYLRTHKYTHGNFRPFNCEKCHKGFNSKQQLERHNCIKDNNKEKHFKCSHCSYSSNYRSHLNYHVMALHTKEEDKVYFYCPKCPYKATQKSAVSSHLNSHETNKSFQCKECDFETNIRYQFIKHKKEHKASKS